MTDGSATGRARRCAFLTRGRDGAITSDDALTARCLEECGVEVVAAPWRGPVPIDVDLVVVRSPWDYTANVDEFVATLRDWSARVRVANHEELIAWNAHKTYLGQLAEWGVEIVPTRFLSAEEVQDEALLREALVPSGPASDRPLVIKPTVGATAQQAFVVDSKGALEEVVASYHARSGHGALIQPRVENVLREGEFSLMYFGGRYSHTVLKTPRAGDFRVHEEFGGRNVLVEPEAALREAAERSLAAARELVPGADAPLYARVDLVRSDDDPERFWLMELELIEPALLLGMWAEAPQRFAEAIVAALG